MNPATFKPLGTIGETIIAYRKAFKNSTPEEITAFIKKHWKNCNTNPASVACTLGKAAKKMKDPSAGPWEDHAWERAARPQRYQRRARGRARGV